MGCACGQVGQIFAAHGTVQIPVCIPNGNLDSTAARRSSDVSDRYSTFYFFARRIGILVCGDSYLISLICKDAYLRNSAVVALIFLLGLIICVRNNIYGMRLRTRDGPLDAGSCGSLALQTLNRLIRTDSRAALIRVSIIKDDFERICDIAYVVVFNGCRNCDSVALDRG